MKIAVRFKVSSSKDPIKSARSPSINFNTEAVLS